VEASLHTVIERASRWNTWSTTVFDELTHRIGNTPDAGAQRRYRDGAFVVSYQFEDERGDVYFHVWARDSRSGAFLCLRWEKQDPAAVAASITRIVARLARRPISADATRRDVYEFSFGPLNQ
jgi:hypothetical protein